MAKHTLKTWREPFDAVLLGTKRFEVRRNDRCFQSGDTVVLKRWHQDKHCFDSTAAELTFQIGWMLHGGQFGIEPGFCVFQLID
jgi:hypothetical protein